MFGDKGFIGTDYITILSASQNAVSYCNDHSAPPQSGFTSRRVLDNPLSMPSD